MPTAPSDDVFKPSGKPKPGRGAAGVEFDPNQPASAAPIADEVATLNRPRPATTRYPISDSDFAALEAAATTAKAKATKGVVLVADKCQPGELASAAPGVAMPAGLMFSTVFYVSLLFTYNGCFSIGKADAPVATTRPPD